MAKRQSTPRPKPLVRTCERCGNTFTVQPKDAARRPAKFCSVSCAFGTDEDRFWSKVEKTPSCWLWSASVNRQGYGHFCRAGLPVRAHRFSYELHHGAIPDGMKVLHQCDNPRCVNPSHLFLGTTQDNVADRVAKDRTAKGDNHGAHTRPDRVARGERQHSAKLTEAKVRDVRQRFAAGGITKKALAAEHGVTPTLVGLIIKRKIWQHVD